MPGVAWALWSAGALHWGPLQVLNVVSKHDPWPSGFISLDETKGKQMVCHRGLLHNQLRQRSVWAWGASPPNHRWCGLDINQCQWNRSVCVPTNFWACFIGDYVRIKMQDIMSVWQWCILCFCLFRRDAKWAARRWVTINKPLISFCK